MQINNVILPCQSSATDVDIWDIVITDGKVSQIRPSNNIAGEPPKLLLPALCHPHIHLDKPFILTSGRPSSNTQPDYSDLLPRTGSFEEALTNTSNAKERYTEDDLYLRGAQLLATSYEQGVTSLRAFVEIDHATGPLPLTIAIRLKSEFSHLLCVQICAFAQDPIFSTVHGEANRSIITSALGEYASSIQALGTTPYVEATREASLQNIEWAIATALQYDLHLDFHLDYNLALPSPSSPPLTFSVLELLKKHRWLDIAKASKTIVLGHCTQLTLLCDSDLQTLAKTVIQSGLPLHFVGLPNSDMFMMGRPSSAVEMIHSRPRGTLHVPSMIKDLGLSACIGVNNVGNAFTPFGSGDPLQAASWGVGIYQAGTVADAMMLYGCVSWLAKRAIGLEGSAEDNDVIEGKSLQGMLLIKNKEYIKMPSTSDRSELKILARKRMSIKDIVWDPPETTMRSIIE
ncbi:Metallo-dependent hydrolase [Annulohypoxylon maeteangense]|uniref:Metallo-dependent hydrolase n=1 Tax=Annulohypoxylon maeteangense TaxID=1927788 RepID=UPI002007CBE0|nr:Metallo-dependent hydrolase [Annulohypoxylon maeteangense]KAI0881005.1 Metallo-dependent hydrolase [Annulohypoxylon maeteangense]